MFASAADGLTSAAAAGIPCVIWTVNAPQAIDHYLAHPAVEGVVTDRSALALERRARLLAGQDPEPGAAWITTPVRITAPH